MRLITGVHPFVLHFLKPRNHVEFSDLPPETRKRATKRKTIKKRKKTNASGNSSKEPRTNSKNRCNTRPNPVLAVPSPSFHFLATLQWKHVEFLPRMKVGDNVFVCTGTKNGVECGFALCNECKQRCSTGRGSRHSRGVASTASNSLTDEEKNILTGCHSDHSKL